MPSKFVKLQNNYTTLVDLCPFVLTAIVSSRDTLSDRWMNRVTVRKNINRST